MSCILPFPHTAKVKLQKIGHPPLHTSLGSPSLLFSDAKFIGIDVAPGNDLGYDVANPADAWNAQGQVAFCHLSPRSEIKRNKRWENGRQNTM